MVSLVDYSDRGEGASAARQCATGRRFVRAALSTAGVIDMPASNRASVHACTLPGSWCSGAVEGEGWKQADAQARRDALSSPPALPLRNAPPSS
ncbi:hypothetical protein CC85DRAFT_283158 [Cutaneotrichosporon oleaginosum]|uniref:Uncharacterized protein n=1 Tax=Cutaneotrichosporon oleaginosum TaxID=879819 RepID=A0A0J0XUS5_9TREE|nr:uncharacterized protein CC85DRAFT_283158 [Cutaneotrichosporon oleaginosum]KLT44856.1 hypothetical protein CC85DRAFT_283158 [Cutaneotrichosporon oleaginosum]TXT11991.1 hypothetical protein COLE_02401 [Cutaneotrichosporon oleaginosum]